MIYRIASKDEWKKAQRTGWFRPADLESDGFVHCCASDQVNDVAKGGYPEHKGMLLLEIDESSLESEVRWENLEGGSEFYPHVYGPIPVSAIGQVSEFRL